MRRTTGMRCSTGLIAGAHSARNTVSRNGWTFTINLFNLAPGIRQRIRDLIRDLLADLVEQRAHHLAQVDI